MADYTENLNLILPKQSESYDVEVANTNNKIIDAQISNKVDKVVGKDLSTNDFTNAYKAKLDNLENYDDTEIKQDIEDIKTKNTLQDTEINNIKAKDTAQDEAIEALREEKDAEIAKLQEKNEALKKQLPKRRSKWRICAFEGLQRLRVR